MNALIQRQNLASRLFLISFVFTLLVTFINIQYAQRVSVHKVTVPFSLDVKHPIKQLVKSRFYRGDMVNSYQSSQFAVTILCPKELALLVKQLARGIHLCGLTAGLCKFASGLACVKRNKNIARQLIATGATIFGCAYFAPDYIRALAQWSLGYAPF